MGRWTGVGRRLQLEPAGRRIAAYADQKKDHLD